MRLVKNTTYASFDGARILQTGALSFDASTFELWGALLNGGTVTLAESDTVTGGDKLAAVIRSRGINMMFMTTQLFNHLADSSPRVFEGLSHLMIGGEKLSAKHVEVVRAQHPLLRISNGYGPTENTTFSLSFDIDKLYDNIPIGKPISNSTAYIRSGNQLCGIGVPGELYVGGDGVARGYLNRPELTAEMFIANPYAEGELMYRTGDLARWLPDGNIEYLGRMDEQVKIRGFRIELGEIESVLRKQPGIRDTVVAVKEDASGEKYICAYIVLEDESMTFDLMNCRNELPAYMVPSYFVKLTQLPVTSNGKLNRRALPEPERSGNVDGAAPQSETEAKLVEVYQEVLGVTSVGTQDSFFDLGGHSLRAMRLINLIESQLGVRLPLRAVFEHPTVEALSRQIVSGQDIANEPIPLAEQKDSYAMSSSQKRLFVIQQMDPSSIVYNMPGMLDMLGEVDLQRISRVFEQLIARHESLRTSFHLIEGEPSQRIHEQVNASVEFGESEGQTGDKLLAEFVRPFDVSEAPLIRMKVVKTGDGRNVLLFDMHHLISDGATIQIITKEFSQLYNGELLELPTVQYKDYSEWQRTRDLSKHQEYWLSQFGDDLPVLDLPLDYPRPHIQSFNGAALHQQMNVEVREQVQLLGRKTGATEYMVLLSSLMVLLSKYSRQEDIIVGSPVSGRTHHDTEQMVGMFVGTLALRGKPEGSKSYQDFLTEVKEMSLKAYEHQTYPFEDLVEQVQVRRDLSRNPIFDVMLVLQNNEEEQLDAQGMAFGDLETEARTAKFDLTLNVTAAASGYQISWEYNSDLFKLETIARMAAHFEWLVQALTKTPAKHLFRFNMMTNEEEQQIIAEFNDTTLDYPADRTIHSLFEEQVRRTPEHTALLYQEQSMSYGQLDQRVNRMAGILQKSGVSRGEIVGILVGRSMEMIISILAVLKAGGAYLPIDPEYPTDRVVYMLEDSQAKILLTEAAIYEAHSIDFQGKMIDVKEDVSAEADLLALM